MIYRLAYDGETGMMGKKGKFKDFDSDHPEIKLFWEINDMQLRHSYELNEKSTICIDYRTKCVYSRYANIHIILIRILLYFDFTCRNCYLCWFKYNSI